MAISEPVVGGVQPTITDGDCLIDVRLQDEGEDLAGKGVPIDWHADGNIIVKVSIAEFDCVHEYYILYSHMYHYCTNRLVCNSLYICN